MSSPVNVVSALLGPRRGAEDPKRPSHLGLDFGNDASKACLSFQNESGETEIIRVSVSGLPTGHPDRSSHTNATDFGFPSCAVLEDGRLRTGRFARHKPGVIQLKTMLTYVAGCGRAVVHGCPDGTELLELVDGHFVTAEMMRAVLREHFQSVLSLAQDQAVAAGLYVTMITLSRPTYLQKQDCWLERYEAMLLDVVSSVWQVLGETQARWVEPEFVLGAEAQCIGLYLCERFRDPLGSFNREKLLHALGDLGAGKEQINWLVADTGGSTLNLHVQTTYVKEGDVSSQTNLGRDWMLGSQGGSQAANRLMRDEIKQRLSPDIPSDELAKILEQFEAAKYAYDYTRSDNPTIVLHGLTGSYRQLLAPSIFGGALDSAFRPAIDAIIRLTNQVSALRQDFVVVACGGTAGNPGYKNALEGLIKPIRSQAREDGVRIEVVFLADYDYHASTAAAVGASLCTWRVPNPVDVLGHAAMAVQVQAYHKRFRRWVGEKAGNFLFCKGGGTPNYLRTSYQASQRRRTRLQLVCDPTFPLSAKSRPSQLPIGSEEDVLCGPISAYDVGMPIPLNSIPPGLVYFFVGSEDVAILTSGQVAKLAKSTLVLRISCYQYNPRNPSLRTRHQSDTTWKVVLKTDPLSKNLICSMEALPVWCDECHAELFEVGFQCRECKSQASQVGLCEQCYDKMDCRHNHNRTPPHEFDEVAILSFGRPLWCRDCDKELYGKAHLCQYCTDYYAVCRRCLDNADDDEHTHEVEGKLVYGWEEIDVS